MTESRSAGLSWICELRTICMVPVGLCRNSSSFMLKRLCTSVYAKVRSGPISAGDLIPSAEMV